MKERLVLWDIAKGICIILVVIGHYCPANAPDWYSLINRFIYSFHMPVFLFASGYIYMATQKDVSYIAFMRKKIKRLMIPYVSTSVIIVAIKLVSQNFFYMKNPVTGFTFLEILYKPAAGYFLWFIWVLWWAFLIIPFFKTTGQRLLLLAVSIAFYALPLDMGELFCLQEVKEMLLFFVMGVLSYELKDKLSRLSPFGIVLIFSFVLSEFFYLFYPHLSMTASFKFVTSILGIYAVYVVSKFIMNRYRPVLLLQTSAASYVIYLFHTTFEGLAKGVINKIGWTNLCNMDIVFTINAAIIIAAGIIIPVLLQKHVLERFNTTKFLFGLK